MGTKLGDVGSSEQYPFLTATNGIGTPNQSINPNGGAVIACGSYTTQPYSARLVCEGWMKVIWTGHQHVSADVSASTPTPNCYSNNTLQWARLDDLQATCDVPVVAFWSNLAASSTVAMRVYVTCGSGPYSLTVYQVMLMWRESRL